jgi:hypothetical protein
MTIPSLKKALASDTARLNRASFTWLAGRVMHLYQNKSIPGAINQRNYTQKHLFGPGDVFIYHYDPKLKDILPYYDKFPLVVVLKLYDDGFLGLNLHYLPPDVRLVFMNKLIQLARVGPTVPGANIIRMQITYDLMVSSQRFNAHVPCVKRYLIGHVRSRMLRIFPHEWSLIIHLPFEAFVKASKQKVWADSRKLI